MLDISWIWASERHGDRQLPTKAELDAAVGAGPPVPEADVALDGTREPLPGTSAAEHRLLLESVLIHPSRMTFAEAVATLPNVGKDEDFTRKESKNA